MKENFEKALGLVLKEEGGFANDPQDPGGATMKGITKARYEEYLGHPVTVAQLQAISEDQIRSIYKTGYWDKVNGDRLFSGVDLNTFDAAVTSGPGRAKEWLMASIGGKDHETVQLLADRRRTFLRGLRTFSRFGNGWLNRTARMEATGVSMALAQEGMTPEQIQAELKREQDRANQAGNTAGGAAAGGSAAGGGVLATAPHLDPSFFIVLILVALILGGLVWVMIHKRRANAAKAQAYGEAAAQLQGAIPEPTGV